MFTKIILQRLAQTEPVITRLKQMQLQTKNSLDWFEFPHLAEHPGLVHAVFTRNHGYSNPPYDSLNVGMHVGDATETVRRNRAAIVDCLGGWELVEIHQVHGTHVLSIHPGAVGNTADLFQGDAVITNITGKLLLIQTADCQPILLYDPVRQVIANIHSGWKGSILNIIQKTIQNMVDNFACRPHHLLAGVGPSLGPCCAEFIHYQNEIPEQFWGYKDARDHFNFWALSANQLTAAGVLSRNIHISGLCTRCRPDLFFSYRRHVVTGRCAAVIGLRGLGANP